MSWVKRYTTNHKFLDGNSTFWASDRQCESYGNVIFYMSTHPKTALRIL
jgi:hypothetical protein